MVLIQVQEVEAAPEVGPGWTKQVTKMDTKMDNSVKKRLTKFWDSEGTEYSYAEVKKVVGSSKQKEKKVDKKRKSSPSAPPPLESPPKEADIELNPQEEAPELQKRVKNKIMFMNNQEKTIDMDRLGGPQIRRSAVLAEGSQGDGGPTPPPPTKQEMRGGAEARTADPGDSLWQGVLEDCREAAASHGLTGVQQVLESPTSTSTDSLWAGILEDCRAAAADLELGELLGELEAHQQMQRSGRQEERKSEAGRWG
jgi:hypothetical protein